MLFVFNSKEAFTMDEAAQMLYCLPRAKRLSRLMSYRDISAKNGYIEGFVAKPALPKRLNKCYLVQTRDGLWL